MADAISIREFARRERVSDTLVHRAIKEGRLGKLPDGRMDAALVGTPWRAGREGANVAANDPANTSAPGLQSAGGSPVGGTSGGAKGVTYGEALRLKENWLALLRRLDYEQRSGALVEISLAQRVVFELCREQRDAWLAWPVRIAPLVAAEFGIADLDRFTAALSEHVYQQLAELGEPNPEFRSDEA